MSTQRIRPADESATHTSEGVHSATPRPAKRNASTDGPPSPLKDPDVAFFVSDVIKPDVRLKNRSRVPEFPSV